MNNKLITVVVVVVVVIGGFLLFKERGVAPAEVFPVDENITEETAIVPSIKEFTINAVSYSFSPSTMVVNKGDTVKITVKNIVGTHDLKIDEFNTATRILNAGEEQTITFVADKAGDFQYYCSVGAHRAQGMWGTLTVR